MLAHFEFPLEGGKMFGKNVGKMLSWESIGVHDANVWCFLRGFLPI